MSTDTGSADIPRTMRASVLVAITDLTPGSPKAVVQP